MVQIADRFSIVEVPEEAADSVIESMKRASLRGQRVTIRRDREKLTRQGSMVYPTAHHLGATARQGR